MTSRCVIARAKLPTTPGPFALFALLAMLLLAAPAFPQEDLQYQRRGNRYEGIKAKPVSGYDIELLSARIQHGEDLTKLGARLGVRFFLKEVADVHVFVREVEHRHYYWLDRIVPAAPWGPGFDNVFEWPVSDVLGRLPDFKPADLGVLVRLGKATPGVVETVAPALFYQSRLPARATGYLFTFRLRDDAKVTATFYRKEGDEVLARQVFPRQAGGRAFTVRWDLTATTLPEGAYKLVLGGYFLDSNEPVRQIVSFHHQPSLPAR